MEALSTVSLATIVGAWKTMRLRMILALGIKRFQGRRMLVCGLKTVVFW